MKHKIEHRKSVFRNGTNVLVRLDIADIEHKIIRDNNMEAVTIVIQPPTYSFVEDKKGKKEKVTEDNNIYFRDLYGRRTSWHCDSVLEAQDLHKKFFEGLKQFNVYLEANMSPVEDTEGDLLDRPDEFSINLIPDHMWPQHVYVLSESGGGKTQLLQTIFAQHMGRKIKPGYIIIDSQREMLTLIHDRFPDAIVIDPINNPVSLDIFNPGLFDYSTITAIDTFRYLFEAGGQPLTGPQLTAFIRGIALMLIGFPKAMGRNATIEDFEEYLIGNKKGKELPPNAHKAADMMPLEERNWYYNQYAGFDASHGQILQRLNLICGPYTALRPLFKKQHDDLNLYNAIESGRTILINTDHEKLGRYASSFFGRFILTLIDKNIAHRSLRSSQTFLMVDEVQEYFDKTVIEPFLNQARKRNVSCIFAHQRLSQLPADLRDAMMGVGTLMATNLNDADVKEVSNRFRVEMDQVRAWRPEFRKDRSKPTYADFGLFYKGLHSANTFRLKYLQLEAMAKQTGGPKTEKPRSEKQSQKNSEQPPQEEQYDDRYDIEEIITVSPVRAKAGYVHTVKCPNRQTQTISITATTANGARFCFKGMSGVRRPDDRMGNYWVQVNIPQREDF